MFLLKNTVNINWKPPGVIFLILLIVTLTFRPVLNAEFTNYDDPGHLLQNPDIRALNASNAKKIFSRVVDTYIPLTMLSFAIEYHFFELQPFYYHLDNLILHLLVTLLVFRLGFRMGLGVWSAGLGALLFGIHPMRVESVAWITERKDLLYSFFYLLSLHQYWSYLNRKSHRALLLSACFGLLSILAKPMALSLPFILLILDWFRGRRLTFSVFLEKCIYLAYIIPIAYITYSQHPGYYAIPGVLKSFLTAAWSLMFYIRKFIVPVNLAPLYVQPRPLSFINIEYAASVILLLVYATAAYRYRRHRWFTFANLYFLFSIFFLIRLIPDVAVNITADRFMYLPSLGFCLFAGFAVQQIWNKIRQNHKWRFTLAVTLCVLLAGLAHSTFRLSKIWQDEVTLWNHTIKINPAHPYAYLSRGAIYAERGEKEKAFLDFSMSIALKPDYSPAYNNRGILLAEAGRFKAAIADFTRGIRFNPHRAEIYFNRGLAYTHLAHDELGLRDYCQSLALKPGNSQALRYRATLYRRKGQFRLAVEDLSRAIRHNPQAAELYYERAQNYASLGIMTPALRDAQRAKDLGYPGMQSTIREIETLKKQAQKRASGEIED